jgi:hypothetical protein
MTRTYIEGIEANGAPLNLQFATMFFRHALPLALSDFILVLSTGICVPFAKLLAKGYIRVPLDRSYHSTFVADFGARDNRQVDFRPVSRPPTGDAKGHGMVLTVLYGIGNGHGFRVDF